MFPHSVVQSFVTRGPLYVTVRVEAKPPLSAVVIPGRCGLFGWPFDSMPSCTQLFVTVFSTGPEAVVFHCVVASSPCMLNVWMTTFPSGRVTVTVRVFPLSERL